VRERSHGARAQRAHVLKKKGEKGEILLLPSVVGQRQKVSFLPSCLSSIQLPALPCARLLLASADLSLGSGETYPFRFPEWPPFLPLGGTSRRRQRAIEEAMTFHLKTR
jgi:hypothetical protein